MRPDADRCGVIGKDRNNSSKLCPYCSHYPVHILDRPHLFLNTPQMPRLVRGLAVDIDNVEVPDCVESIPCLCQILRVEIPGRAGDGDDLHAGTAGDPIEQINSRYHAAVLMVLFRECGKCGTFTPAPWPYLRGRGFTRF